MRAIRLFEMALLITAGLFFNSSAVADNTNPLGQDELNKILSLTTQTSATAQRSSTPSAKAATTPELLLVERKPTNKDYPELRLADVYQYDYQRNETIHSIVNVATNQIISSSRQQYLQLPLTENELNRAKSIIFADPEQLRLIENEYLRITGQYLSSPDQLNIKAFVFTEATLPEQLNSASKQCGLHRCAQILMYTADAIVFEISPIVNLSVGIVTQNIGY